MPKIKIDETMADISQNDLSESDTTHPLKRAKYATDGIGGKSSSPPTKILNGFTSVNTNGVLQNGNLTNGNGHHSVVTAQINPQKKPVTPPPQQQITASPYFLRSTDLHLQNFLNLNLEQSNDKNSKDEKTVGPKMTQPQNSNQLRSEHKDLTAKIRQLKKEEKRLDHDKFLAILENLNKARGFGSLSNQVSSNFSLEKMKPVKENDTNNSSSSNNNTNNNNTNNKNFVQKIVTRCQKQIEDLQKIPNNETNPTNLTDNDSGTGGSSNSIDLNKQIATDPSNLQKKCFENFSRKFDQKFFRFNGFCRVVRNHH